MENVVELKERESEKLYYTANDIVQMFSIARSTVDSWAKQGMITKKKFGKCVRFSVYEVDRLAEVL